jgi:hypothetical protein
MYTVSNKKEKVLNPEDIKYVSDYYIVSEDIEGNSFCLLIPDDYGFSWLNLLKNEITSARHMTIREAIEFEFIRYKKISAFENITEFVDNLALST